MHRWTTPLIQVRAGLNVCRGILNQGYFRGVNNWLKSYFARLLWHSNAGLRLHFGGRCDIPELVAGQTRINASRRRRHTCLRTSHGVAVACGSMVTASATAARGRREQHMG